jgi:hypothetical protein
VFFYKILLSYKSWYRELDWMSKLWKQSEKNGCSHSPPVILKNLSTPNYTKLSNIRRDRLHNFSSALSKSHAVLVLEDLQIRPMTKSAKGDRENPGSRVAQKSDLNRAILDQGWGMFKIFFGI